MLYQFLPAVFADSRPLRSGRLIRLLSCLAFLCGTSLTHAQQASSPQPAATPVTAANQQKLEYEQQQRAKLNAMLAEQAQEADAAKQRQQQANAESKQKNDAIKAAKKKKKK